MINYLKNWNIMRVLQLVLGIFIVVQGIMTNEWMLMGLGGLFTIMPLMNIGCCGVSACPTRTGRSGAHQNCKR